tara:strand:+ start:9276 stop:10238 length:963 start_codon:yes stop_codon:yes gene_type:complete
VKIYINNPGENWIVDRIRKEWYDQKPDISTENVQEADLVWILAPWQWQTIDPRLLRDKRVLCTIHHVVPNKFTTQKMVEFQYRDQYVDAYHVPNKYTASFVSQITDKPIHIISYWSNANLWQPMDKAEARNSIGIDEGKFVIGSFQRDTEGSDLVSPKMEKGPDKFCDTVERIISESQAESDEENPAKDVLVLLGGWRRQYVINRLDSAGIEYKYIEMAPIDKIREMYACCDLYIVSSRHEGGPQALFEASSMKTPIISTRVGCSENVLHPNCIFHSEQKKIHIPKTLEVEKCHENVQEYDIITHIEKYVSMIEEVHDDS